MEKINYLRFNLQHFAEGDAGGGDTSGGFSWSGAAGIENPLLAGNEPAPSDPGQQQQQQPPVEELDFGGRKLQANDPALRALHGDWQELNRTFQAERQRTQLLEQQLQMFQQMQQQQQQLMQQQQVQTPKPQGPTPEQIEEAKTQYMEKFYEDPIAAERWKMNNPVFKSLMEESMRPYIEQAVKPYVDQFQQFQQQQQMQQQVNALTQKYSDFQQHVPKMQEILQQNPALANVPNAMEQVYFMARGASVQASPEQLLSDPNFLQQHVLNNEQIRQQIVNSYLQNKQQTNQQVPPVMGNQPGGAAPATPPTSPKSIAEAGKAFRAFLGI